LGDEGEKLREKGERGTLGRNKYAKIDRGATEKKPKLGIGISKAQDPACQRYTKVMPPSNLRQACDLRRE